MLCISNFLDQRSSCYHLYADVWRCRRYYHHYHHYHHHYYLGPIFTQVWQLSWWLRTAWALSCSLTYCQSCKNYFDKKSLCQLESRISRSLRTIQRVKIKEKSSKRQFLAKEKNRLKSEQIFFSQNWKSPRIETDFLLLLLFLLAGRHFWHLTRFFPAMSTIQTGLTSLDWIWLLRPIFSCDSRVSNGKTYMGVTLPANVLGKGGKPTESSGFIELALIGGTHLH